MSDDGVLTQTRYGSPLDKLDLRGGADRGTVAHACSTGLTAESAPFLWLDDHRLLVVMLQKGEVSAALDHYERPFRVMARDAARLHGGIETTANAVASGAARLPRRDAVAHAILRNVDVRTRTQTTIAKVPAYPFHGSLTASVSHDGKRLAVLATVGALQPQADRRSPNVMSDSWIVERRLGFVNLGSGGPLRWTAMGSAARYPLELYGWSPDSRSVALRARADAYTAMTPLFVVDADQGHVVPFGPRSIGTVAAGVDEPHPPAVMWVDDAHLAARTTDGKWVLAASTSEVEVSVSSGATLPEQLVRGGDRSLVGFAGDLLVKLDPVKAALMPLRHVGGDASFQLLEDGGVPATTRLASLHRIDGTDVLASINTVSGAIGPSIPVVGTELLDADLSHGAIISNETKREGLYLRRISLSGDPIRQLLALNTYLGSVTWGETRLIQYKDDDGAELNASVILPPGYSTASRYPTLVWVYGGYRVPSGLNDDYMTSPSMPGIYNLHLYAARGYVVLVPSIPLGGRDGRHDVYAQIPKGVLPAIDKLVALGIADPTKLGVFGQSYGGYSVYALVSQTNRFKAAIAIAGDSDLASSFGQFDPTARGYPGVDHEKSDNWMITDQFGLHGPPWLDADNYARNSPLKYIDRVNTPLLMMHGDLDIRSASTQAEQFFFALYAQGKPAEFVRYGGESHSLAQSPANVRDAYRRTITWFDRYLTPAARRVAP